MNAKSSLSAFVAKASAPVEIISSQPRKSENLKKQSVRLTKEQWIRVSHLALDQERSFQELCIEGLSKLFTERGLPPL